MKIDVAAVPGTSPLYLDYLKDFDKLSQFYELPFESSDSFVEQATRLKTRSYERDALCTALRKQNDSFGAGTSTFENLDRLARGAGGGRRRCDELELIAPQKFCWVKSSKI